MKHGIMVAYYEIEVVPRFYMQGEKYAGVSEAGKKGVCTGSLMG